MERARAWYVAYGSNVCRARLTAYLTGTVAPLPGADGPPARGVHQPGPGSARFGAHRGCADATPPVDDRWVEVAHPVRFRGTSPRWGGGVAFLDLEPVAGTATPARAWRLTVAQILGIAGQEARRAEDPPPEVLDGLEPGGTVALGGGWYDTLLRLPDVEGRPALTVTTGRDLPEAEPVEAYLATIAAGRAERDARGQVRPREQA